LAPVPMYRRRRVQLVAGAVLAVCAGISVAVATRERAKPDELALGVAALERQDLAAAERHLSTAPESPQVHYYRALLGWWTQKSTADVTNELDRALAGGLDDRSAAIARGVRSLVQLEYPGVIDTFEQL